MEMLDFEKDVCANSEVSTRYYKMKYELVNISEGIPPDPPQAGV